MIDIVTNQGRYLKNLRQIGTPEEENKVYIEDGVYQQMMSRKGEDQGVYILMGHTECLQGVYETFVENVITVEEITYERNLPVWTNRIWSEVFGKIKQNYEESIIVGWCFRSIAGAVRTNEELTKIHREHFGGIHQIMIMTNPLMQEENVYHYRNGTLVSKDGFFIYYDPQIRKEEAKQEPPMEEEKEPEEKIYIRPQGRYRMLLQEKKETSSQGVSYVFICLLCIMIAIMGMSILKEKDAVQNIEAGVTDETQALTDVPEDTQEKIPVRSDSEID